MSAEEPRGTPRNSEEPRGTYYEQPLLKAPVWTWEVPAYFFVGGAAGAAALVGVAAQLTGGDPKLIRHARWIAAGGAALSGPLLVLDLGRPERFLNMLRVFKPQSPMSVGAWTLTAFGGSATVAVLGEGTTIGDAAAMLSAISGVVMATYTGVLIGATAIPVWAQHHTTLPVHFGASGLASAVSLLELIGHDERALESLGLVAAMFETWTGWRIESQRTEESKALRRGSTAVTVRAGGLFSGPLPLLLRLAGIKSKRFRRAAAASQLLGSLLTRIAWIEAGKASSRDPRPALS